MIRFVYTIILTLISPLFLYGLYKKKSGKPPVGKRWKEHFGVTPSIHGNHPIWIHAVSVGEVLAITPFVRQMKQQFPDVSIVLTTTTPTGAEQAAKLSDIVEHRYMPLDFPFAVKRFIKTINPQKLIIMETELWPNTLAVTAQCNIPIMVVNARLSERSCARYARFRRWFNSLFARHITHLYCQYNDDTKRFASLGFSENKVSTMGSMKFDITVPDMAKTQGWELRKYLGRDRPVWIAASTHKGEDEQILDAHAELVQQFPDAALIIVPRHPERFDDVEALIRAKGWQLARRTQISSQQDFNGQVYLADTMGEMFTLLCASDICFMGGSLIGDKVGGHNLLEPAAIGIPSLTGPSYFNFVEITQKLAEREATFICQDSKEVADQLKRLFGSESQREMASKRAKEVVAENTGAIAATLSHIMAKD